MANLLLFLISTLVYWLAWRLFTDPKSERLLMDKKTLKEIGLFALLCLPFNFNGNVFTVLGNTEGKNVFAVFSFYQKAEQDAVSFLSLGGAQIAKHDALTMFGLSSYQRAGRDAHLIAGMSFYQKAENVAAITLGGISVIQKAKVMAVTVTGISFYQKSNDSLCGVGLTWWQEAEHNSNTTVGLVLYQKAKYQVWTKVGVAIYQKVGEKGKTVDRAFGIFYPLKAPAESKTQS